MMDFIAVPLIVGICIGGVYGVFELFVRRKERITLIEKMSEQVCTPELGQKLKFPSYFPNFSFSALKAGFLLAGLGLGLLVGYFLTLSTPNYGDWHQQRDTFGVIYGACVLLFGGIGLITAFLIELKISKDNK